MEGRDRQPNRQRPGSPGTDRQAADRRGPDRTWLDRRRSRNETVTLLWRDHAHQLQRYLARRGADHSEIDDIVAEVFLAVTRLEPDRLDQLTPGWLFTVALRRLIDRRRSDQRRDRAIGRAEHERRRRLTTQSRLEDGVIDRLDMQAGIADLCDRQRQAVHLRYVEGHSVGRVAEKLGLGYRATESLLARSRRNLAAA